MTSCCRGAPCEQMFTARSARKDLARYRQKGLDQLERRMVDSAVGLGLKGARVLEIGGGIGKLQVELLEAGAAGGEVAELVGAYGPYAEELAHERGLDDRAGFVVADILDDPHSVEPGDVVLLHRVVCCSPDGVELTAAAARLARRALFVTYPRDALWTRFGIRLVNLAQKLFGRSFRAFVHPSAALRAAAEAEGLHVTESARGPVWELTTFCRDA